MATFQFRLARVLGWYRDQCKVEEARLAISIAALKVAEGRIARLDAEREAADRELLERRAIAAPDLAALGFYRLGAKQLAAQLEHERLQRQTELQRQEARVQAARRRARMVEKLRERRHTEFAQAEDRDLESMAGELFLAKWPRSGSRNEIGASDPAPLRS